MSPKNHQWRLCSRCQAVHHELVRTWAKSSLGPYTVSCCPHCGYTLSKTAPLEKRQLTLPLETT